MHDHADTHLEFATVWPYALAFATAAIARPWLPFRNASAYTAASLVATVPTAEALIRETVPYALVAVAVGFVFVVLAFRWRPFAADASRQFRAVCAGLFGVTVVPDLRVLHFGEERSGLEILFSSDGIYLLLVVGVSIGLVAASFAFSRSALNRFHYRVLEFTALGQLFGLFTLRSLVFTSDWFFPVCAIVLAAITLGVGLQARRSSLTVLAAATLVLNAWIQYFVRLQHVVPVAVLLVGFGAGLLALGVWYEKSVKAWLPALREWA